MFNEMNNTRRADAAAHALRAFVSLIPTDHEDAILDLITNLLHLAKREGHPDPGALLVTAEMNFDAEQSEG